MSYLSTLKLSGQTIKSMVELCPNILELTDEEIKEKIYILKKVKCTENQIKSIISSNPMYLDRTNDEVINLIKKIIAVGFKNLNILLDSNPYILNLDSFEIEKYINDRLKNGENLEEIIDELEANPSLFDDM